MAAHSRKTLEKRIATIDPANPVEKEIGGKFNFMQQRETT